MKKLFLVLFLLTALNVFGQSFSKPWLKTFTVNHTCTAVNTTQLDSCITNAGTGEDIVLQNGVTFTYSSDFNLPSGKPSIRVRCQTPSEAGVSVPHCTLTAPAVNLNGDGQWLQEVHVKGPAFNSFSKNGAVVNNVFEGSGAEDEVVGFWVNNISSSNKEVFYGNISRKYEHTLYVQNTSPTTKYVVNNIFQEVLQNGNGRAIHARASAPNKEENIHFLYNILRDAEFIIGDTPTPVIGMEVKDNVLYKANLRVDYNMLGQCDVQNNRLLYSILQHQAMWGSAEGCYSYPTAPNTFKGNVVQKDTGNPQPDSVDYFVARFTSGCSYETNQTHLHSTDDVDDNVYYNGFQAYLIAGGQTQGTTSLSTWKSITAAQGNEYDTNSTVFSQKYATGSRLYDNDFNSKLPHLVVWTFSGSSYTYRTFTQSGGIYNVTDPYGTPVVTFTANVPVGIPISGEFTAYLVRYN